MSTRTIVEFNHDYLDRLKEQGHISEDVWLWIMAYYNTGMNPPHVAGIKVLGSRHHSEKLKLGIK